MMDETGFPTKHPDTTDRRELLVWALRSGIGTCALGISVPAAAYLWPAGQEGPGSGLIKAGLAKDFPTEGSMLVKAQGAPILLIQDGPEKFRAFSAICTHLGCLAHWREGEKDIFCPCHGGRFDLEGKVIGGPPPRPLPRYLVDVVEGEIQIKLKPA